MFNGNMVWVFTSVFDGAVPDGFICNIQINKRRIMNDGLVILIALGIVMFCAWIMLALDMIGAYIIKNVGDKDERQDKD